MLRSQSLLRGRTFFYMTIDGEHEVAQNFYLKKKKSRRISMYTGLFNEEKNNRKDKNRISKQKHKTQRSSCCGAWYVCLFIS